MECAVMKQLFLVAIVLWMSVSDAVGLQHSPLTLHNKGNNAGNIGDLGCPNDTNLCQDGFTLFPSQNCYFFSCITETWDGALEFCRRLGATLAYPQNIVEDSTLSNYLKLRFKGTYAWWLGGSDTATEGKWVWAHDNSAIVYTNWRSGQPDNYGGNEDCLNYWENAGWKWNDFPCSNLYPFVCQQL